MIMVFLSFVLLLSSEAAEKSFSFADDHFSLAQAYAADGKLEQAIEEYKLTLMYDPHSAYVLTRLAGQYLKKGSFSEALEITKRATHEDEKSLEAHLLLGELYSLSKQSDAAEKEYEKVLKLNPAHEEAALYLTQIAVDRGQTARAGQHLEKFLKKNPDSVAGWFYLGRLREEAKEMRKAQSHYEKAIQLRPEFLQAVLALGSLFESEGKMKQAIALYERSYDSDSSPLIAAKLAGLYLAGEKFEKAIPYLKEIQQQDPDNLNTQIKLGLVYMELKKFEDAAQVFSKVLKRSPEAERVRYYLASVYESQGKEDLALEELEKIKETSPLFTETVLHRLVIEKKRGNVQQAKAIFDGAVQKISHPVAGLFLMQASLEEQNQKLPEAVSILEKALSQFPDDERLHYYVGSLYDRLGKSEKSLEHMEAILKKNPDHAEALNYIGYTWTLQKVRMNDAERLLKRALSLRPDNGYIHDSWGYHLLSRGKVKEAVIELEKAVKMSPNEATILDHLADAYLRANLRDKALGLYQQAAKLTEDDGAKKKFEAKIDRLNSNGAERIPASLYLNE